MLFFGDGAKMIHVVITRRDGRWTVFRVCDGVGACVYVRHDGKRFKRDRGLQRAERLPGWDRVRRWVCSCVWVFDARSHLQRPGDGP